MESKPFEPSQITAGRQLRSYESVRDKVQGSSRSFALFTLWSAIVVASYMVIFLFSFGNRSVDEVVATDGYSWNGLIAFPILVFSSLASGARERFGVRTKPSRGHWLAIGLILAGFMTLAGLSISSVKYPWPLNLLMAAAIFFAMASGSLRLLRHPARTDSQCWDAQPLSRMARTSTALIGLVTGLLVATSTQTWFPLLSATVMLLLIAVLMGWQAPWGLPATGYEWAPVHWVSFGIIVSALFLMTTLLSQTSWISTPTSLVTGIIIFALMLAVSFLPTRAQHK